MLTYLNVEPRYDDKEMANVSSVAPSLVGLSPQDAKTKASGYTVKVVGDGAKVVSQTPAAGQQMRSGGVIGYIPILRRKRQLPPFRIFAICQSAQPIRPLLTQALT